MEGLLIGISLIAVCMGFTPLEKRHNELETSDLIQLATDAMHEQNGVKRSSLTDKHRALAFMQTDLDEDGHLTACEFAAYYSLAIDSPELPDLSYNQWKKAFEITLAKVDKNHNGKMELNEYLVKV